MTVSTTFERLQNDIKNIERQSNFERFYCKYDLENENYDKSKYTNIRYNLNEFGGVPLSWNMDCGYVSTEHSDSHTLIVGPTASKKSRLIIMPTVRMLGVAKESMIISDPKAEIYNRTAGFLQAQGYHIKVLNLRNPQYSSGWNPLEIPYQLYCEGNIDRAYEFINDIAINLSITGVSEKDPFWDNSAGTFFVGLAMLLFKYCKEFEQPKSVVHIGSILQLRNVMCSANKRTIMDSPMWRYAKSDLHIMSALIGTLGTANDTRDGILSTFDQKMRIFSTQPNLLNMLSDNEIMYDEIEQNPTALFLILPDEKTTYHGLVSLFIKQSYEYLIYKTQERNRNNAARLKIRLNYVLDEFSSLPTVRDFPAMITAARSRNIRFDIVIQSKHQLMLKYGDDAETILSNCTNWIFLTSREVNFLEEISALCGQKYEQGIMMPVIPMADLQRFNKEQGEVLILSGRFKPYLTRLPDIDIYDKGKLLKAPDYTYKSNIAALLNVDMQAVAKKVQYENNMEEQVSVPFFTNEMPMHQLISLIDDRLNKILDDKRINMLNKVQSDFEVEEILAEIDQKVENIENDQNSDMNMGKKDFREQDNEVQKNVSIFDEDFYKKLSEIMS